MSPSAPDDEDRAPGSEPTRPTAECTVPEPMERDRVDAKLGVLPRRFRILRRLGTGGMGVVVEAFDRVLGRPVAIKVLSDDPANPTLAARFLREARTAAKLRHPGIVQVHDVEPADSYIVMELVRGESLSVRLQREGRLPVAEVLRIGKALLEALGHAHAAGVVHRDVKPANVLLSETCEVKLADFGIAMAGDSELTVPGTALGTPAYMAPEQLRGLGVDARADVYAAGATLFKAATGRRLHDVAPGDVERVLLETTGHRVLSAAIARAVREHPTDRFANGHEFATAIEATEPEPTERTVKVVEGPAPARGILARWWPWLIVGALLCGAAVAVLLLRRPSPGAPGAAPAAASSRTIAMLPFVDLTDAPELDFARGGLSNLLSMELHGAAGLKVLGYYRMESNVGSPEAPIADWVAAARRNGADTVVRGELAPAGGLVRVMIYVETVGGEPIDVIERRAPPREVPETVRGSAARIVKDLVGGEVSQEALGPRPFAADRALQLGIEALERERIEVAVDQLEIAVREAPDLAIAHYYLALALYWRARPLDPARAQIEKALSFELAEQHQGVLQALRHLVDQDYAGGIAVLRPLAERYPDEKHVLYVLFESLFHGGFPSEAMAVYRRITEHEPRFRLALEHGFDYYTSHGDDAGMAWALRQSEPAGDTYDPTWESRVLLARREYDAALRLLSGALERTTDRNVVELLEEGVVVAHALAGRPDLAVAHARKLAGRYASKHALLLLLLANARGDPAERARHRDVALRYVMTRQAGPERINRWIFFASAELGVATPVELAETARGLNEALVSDYSRTLALAVIGVLLADALGDDVRLADLATSPYPEARELAKAAGARRAGDHAAAAHAMRRAIASAPDGRFLIHEWRLLAGDLRALGDHAGVRSACDEVLRPRKWWWGWGSSVGDCLAWSAEAAERLGRPEEARADWQRLAVLRSPAPADDRLASAARAGLARLARR